MSFVSFTDIKNNESPRKYGHRSSSELVVTVSKGSVLKSGHKTKTINFRLKDSLMDRARLLVGDRVDILFDEKNGMGMIKRDNNGAVRLHKNSKEGNTTRLSMRLRSGMAAVKQACGCDDVEISNEGILFKWPEDFYIYQENVKEDLKLVHRNS